LRFCKTLAILRAPTRTRWTVMAKRDDQEIYLQLGRKNESLIQRLKLWCRNIDVKLETSGLLAAMHRLPIGMLKVTCPHGVTGGMSMHVEHEAEQFIVHNCNACPHHQELSNDNLGRDILARIQRVREEEEAAKQRRLEIDRQTKSEAANTLQTQEMTQASVNRLILRLHDPQDAPDAAVSLQKAASLAPEFFSDDALKVLTDGFRTPVGAACVQIVRSVLLTRRNLPTFMPKAVLSAMAAGLDDACNIIVDHFSEFDKSMLAEGLAISLNIPEYEHVPGATLIRTRPSYPGAVRFFVRMTETAPEDVRAVLGRTLGIDSKRTKFNCANFILDLLSEATAEHLVPLTRMLIRSLELTDDAYGESADDAVCGLLAHLYISSPEHVAEEVERTYSFAGAEMRMLLLDIYARVALLGAEHGYRRSGRKIAESTSVAHVPAVVDKLYTALSDLQNDPKVRVRACEMLEDVVAAYPQHGAQMLPRFLTRLVLTSMESKATPLESGTPLAQINNMSRNASYNAMTRQIVKIVERIAAYLPAPTFVAVSEAILDMDSKSDSSLKGQLVRTLAVFGKQYEMTSAVLSEVYRHLTDFESNAVRHAAIEVVKDLMQQNSFPIPDNMIELITTYLHEDFVIIHKSATRVIRHCRFSPGDARGQKVLDRILLLEHAYSSEANVDKNFINDLVDVLDHTFAGWPRIQHHVATVLLPKYGRSKDMYLAQDMLVELSRRLDKFPAAQRPFVNAALGYMAQFPRDRYNDGLRSDRSKIFDALFTVPSEIITEASSTIVDIVRAQAGNDSFEAICFMGLLSHHGLHAETMRIADDSFRKLPNVKSHEMERNSYALIATAERAEVPQDHGTNQ
jgi:hypothetical protein